MVGGYMGQNKKIQLEERVKKPRTRKKLLLALPIYILYVLIVEVYFGFGLGELWDEFIKMMKKFKKSPKQVRRKRKFIRIDIS